MRRIFLIRTLVFIMILNIIIFKPSFSIADTELLPIPEISSESAIVYELSTNSILYEKEIDKKYYPSAVIKMMTAVVALKNASLGPNQIPSNNEIVTVGKELSALNWDYNSTGFKTGDKVALTDLLKALIIANGDDAAIILAVYIGRKDLGGIYNGAYGYDRDALSHFMDMMYHEISLMGIKGTALADPIGYKTGTMSHSTPKDLAIIAKEFLSYSYLRSLCAISSYNYWEVEEEPEITPMPTQTPALTPIPTVLPTVEPPLEDTDEEPEIETPPVDFVEEARKSHWTTINKMMDSKSEEYYEYCRGIIAGKSENGISVAIFAEYHDVEVVVVIMEADESVVYDEVKMLLEYVFSNYIMYTMIEDGTEIDRFFVNNAADPSNQQLIVKAKGSGKYFSHINDLDSFAYEKRYNSELFVPTEEDLNELFLMPEATVTKGDALGTLDLYYEGLYFDTVILYAANTVSAFSNMPIISTKKWFHNVNWNDILYNAGIIVSIFLICMLLIALMKNMKRRSLYKKMYSSESNQAKRVPVKYNRKKRK